jgi:hypothetical protein
VTNQAGGAVQPALAASTRSVVRTGYAAFFLVGWCMLLLPSLIREVEGAFTQTDAGMGLAYLLHNLAWVAGTVSTGVLAGLLYPPLMGFVSETLGLGVSMLGAALFAVGAAIFVVIGARLGLREGAGAGSAVLETAD